MEKVIIHGSLTDSEFHKPRDPCQRVPVLLYHDIRPNANGENGAVISEEEFAAQMEWLHRSGFHTITTAELLGWLRGERELPDKGLQPGSRGGVERERHWAGLHDGVRPCALRSRRCLCAAAHCDLPRDAG